MKSSAYSRRLRNAHLHGEKHKEPFFSPTAERQQPSFFNTQSASGTVVQTKLRIGKAGDQYEQEADQVANKVVAQPAEVQRRESDAVQRVSLMSAVEDEQLGTAEARMAKDKLIQEKVQRMEEQEEVQTKPEEEEVQAKPEEEDVQMQPEEEAVQAKPEEEDVQMKPEEEEVQAKPEEEDVQMQPEEEEIQAKPEKGKTAGTAVSRNIEKAAGGGRPLAGGIRAWLERAFGANFSKVRIHTDANAAYLSKKLGAQAFTRGRDVFFNTGKYRPETSDGKRLLAHEITHVVQQCGREPDNDQQSGR